MKVTFIDLHLDSLESLKYTLEPEGWIQNTLGAEQLVKFLHFVSINFRKSAKLNFSCVKLLRMDRKVEFFCCCFKETFGSR